MHASESRRIIHETSIPVDGQREAYEYTFPILDVPTEVDDEWRTWIEPLVGLDVNGIRDSVRRRFDKGGTQFTVLRDRVLEYVPFAFLVFRGTPLLWLQRLGGERRDFIYLPPETNCEEVRARLEQYALDSPEPATDLFANFGGMGERYPWEAVEFAGRKSNGKTVIPEAKVSFFAGLEYCTELEIQERLHEVKRWLGGITILGGGDGIEWHLGKDGSVCEYTSGDTGVACQFDSLPDMIAALLDCDPDAELLGRTYEGTLGPITHPDEDDTEGNRGGFTARLW
ncbi:MAG: hypothetical protein HQ567_22490 [Candidatus Nealsonbacteria bacterium]|nr:hypothetical protein [Candidatus Nealsonbacteria bacterium]